MNINDKMSDDDKVSELIRVANERKNARTSGLPIVENAAFFDVFYLVESIDIDKLDFHKKQRDSVSRLQRIAEARACFVDDNGVVIGDNNDGAELIKKKFDKSLNALISDKDE